MIHGISTSTVNKGCPTCCSARPGWAGLSAAGRGTTNTHAVTGSAGQSAGRSIGRSVGWSAGRWDSWIYKPLILLLIPLLYKPCSCRLRPSWAPAQLHSRTKRSHKVNNALPPTHQPHPLPPSHPHFKSRQHKQVGVSHRREHYEGPARMAPTSRHSSSWLDHSCTDAVACCMPGLVAASCR